MNLQDLGWTEDLAQALTRFAGLIPARVALEHRGGYEVYTTDGLHTAQLAGKLRHQSKVIPAVGDWVVLRDYVIQGILPRTSTFSRQGAGEATREQIICTNVNTVFLVNGLDRDFNLRRLERYLLLTWESGANPVIVLNKADQCPDLADQVRATERMAMGVPVIPVIATQQQGIDQLRSYLRVGQTVALLGSSGVGKSTLTNALLGYDRQITQAVRADDQRGRHTTTHRELIWIESGGLIMDTPGMRELGVWANEESLQQTFGDLETWASTCRFRNCAHQTEPGCGIQAALKHGRLDPGRWQSYQKLKQELAYLATKQDKQAQLAEKERWKKLQKAQRSQNKRI